jgi:hypothetical protein
MLVFEVLIRERGSRRRNPPDLWFLGLEYVLQEILIPIDMAAPPITSLPTGTSETISAVVLRRRIESVNNFAMPRALISQEWTATIENVGQRGLGNCFPPGSSGNSWAQVAQLTAEFDTPGMDSPSLAGEAISFRLPVPPRSSRCQFRQVVSSSDLPANM